MTDTTTTAPAELVDACSARSGGEVVLHPTESTAARLRAQMATGVDDLTRSMRWSTWAALLLYTIGMAAIVAATIYADVPLVGLMAGAVWVPMGLLLVAAAYLSDRTANA